MEYLKEGKNYFQDYNLEQFEFSVRTRNVFEEANINLLSQLVSFHRHELLRLPNFGRRSLKEIEEFLFSMNLSFRMFLEEFKVLSPYDENNELILYKGSEILKMDIFKLSKTQKNFPLYKKSSLSRVL